MKVIEVRRACTLSADFRTFDLARQPRSRTVDITDELTIPWLARDPFLHQNSLSKRSGALFCAPVCR